ncbi:MAG: DUF167 domain-containing protein [Hyphomicrobiales bacterium]|nr:DUF167 domain-containing protein [Hyphomicrobiales bacterium]
MVASAAPLRLEVRLTPRASRDLIEGEARLSDGRCVLAARVRAVPEKGAANEALLALLAKSFGVARSRVSLVAGASSRMKSVRIEGDPASLAAALAALRKISSPKKETA